MATASELAAEYRKGADHLRNAVKGMTRDQLIARPVPGKWSTMEVVCHLAEYEPILADRMKRIIALENPLLLVGDENLFVQHLYSHERDLDEELNLVTAVRTAMCRIIANLTPEQLARPGVHSAKGKVSLEGVIQGAIDHIHHHLKFVMEKRKVQGIG